MRKFVMVGMLLAAATLQIGCIVPIWDTMPDVRTQQLIFSSEGLRHIPRIWERIWGLDMPDTATPFRTHGGVI